MKKKFAVLGNPIAHSLSPQIHQAFAAQFNINLDYARILAPLDKLAETLHEFQQNNGLGINITLPFKTEAVQLVQQMTERARKANAINTITFQQGNWLGDNTDGIGLYRDLVHNKNITITNQSILLLGAGGAAKGILADLLTAKPNKIVIANRTFAKAEQLANEFNADGNCYACDLSKMPEQAFDIIINATSAGIKNEAFALPAYLINNSMCYDLAYGAAAQPFLAWAKQHGAKIYSDGLGMLVEQAAEAFYSWHSVRPQTQSVIELLKSDK